MNKRFAPGKGVTERPPAYGPKCFLFLLATHPWKLITLNLLFLMFCLPVVTIPAAFCGMNRVLIMLVRKGNCFMWSDFFTEFKSSLFKSLPFGVLSAFLLLDVFFAFSVAGEAGGNGMSVLPAAVGFLLLVFAVLFSGYVFVLLPTLTLRNRDAARNAFIFMMTEWKTNLVILGATSMTALITVVFFPYTIILLLFFGYSFPQLAVCVAVNQPMQRRIIAPFEQQQKDGRQTDMA